MVNKAPVSDAWSRMQPGKVHLFDMLREQAGSTLVGSLLDAGFAFYVIDERHLFDARVDGRELVIDKARYKAVVVPGAVIMPPQTMDLLVSFVRAGGTVVATRRRPSQAPGFKATGEQHAHVARAAETLLGGQHPGGLFVEQDAETGTRLATQIEPDVRWHASASDVGFVHRRVGDADVYFLANTGNRAVTATATLRAGRDVQRWDAVSGDRVRVASTGAGTGGAIGVSLAPYESAFYIVTDDGGARTAAAAAPSSCEPRGGRVDMAQGWHLVVPGIGPRPLAALTSWHEQADLRDFSGVMTYRREVDVSPAMLTAPCGVWLDFGEGTAKAEEPLTNGMRAWLEAPVREGARVFVNGTDVGAVWAPPYRIRLGTALVAGRNVIEVRVGNTVLNRWASRPQPDYRLLHLRYGKRFDPQDIDRIVAQPSGLIGTPRLMY